MGERLAAPPLIEAVCEFRFLQEEDWDWTLPGRLYDQISSEFPERSQVRQMGVRVQLPPTGHSTTEIVPGPERVQLRRSDESAMVQLGPGLFVINQLHPYEGWEAFKALILRMLDRYLELLSEAPTFERIGLRYINRIKLPEGCDLGDFMTLEPSLSGALDRPLVGLFQRYELLYEAPRGVLVLQTGIQKLPAGNFLMIDLDFGSAGPPFSVSGESPARWLDAAHERVHEAFIASLSVRAYAQFLEGTT